MDDKTYKEIREEALSLIPHYTPEWTNHNPSDPGVTLVELFSWMTEMVLFRLNKVPEKTYLALLDLMGLSLSSPQASRVLLTFKPTAGYEGLLDIKKGFRVSTGRNDGDQAISFETDKRIGIRENRIVSCISSFQSRISDFTEPLHHQGEGFPLFRASDEVSRYLYIQSADFQFLQESNLVCLQMKQAGEVASAASELIRFFSWSLWDGERWQPVEPAYFHKGERRKENTVYFSGPLNIASREIDGQEGFYIRACLDEMPREKSCFDCHGMVTKLIFSGDGLAPDSCLFNSVTFIPLDLNKDFKPFQEAPVVNDIFYLSSHEVFSKKGAKIQINVLLNEAVSPSFPGDSLSMRYEYWNGKDWMILGVSTPGEEAYASGSYSFRDGTKAFCESGVISFLCPDDIREKEVNGVLSTWIRVRISVEDLGKGGGYSQSPDGKWNWYFSEKIVPPVVSRLRLSYDSGFRSVENLKVYSDFAYSDHTREIRKNFEAAEKQEPTDPVTLITVNDESAPATGFGFEHPLPAGESSLFFELDEKDRQDFYREDLVHRKNRQITLRWEYRRDNTWEKLNVNDFTDSFHRSGFIEFQIPVDWKQEEQYGQSLCWMRVVFENGSFESMPVIKNVHLNSVYGSNKQTFYNEKLGSGSGSPLQEYDLVRYPILPGIVIEVREDVYPPENERSLIEQEEGPGAVRKEQTGSGKEEVWVTYHQVPHFHESTAVSRHYVLDYQKNKILFGDGKKGVIPPRGKNNIVIRQCSAGGGVRGNIGAGQVKVLRESLPFLAGVENPLPAMGGADLESLENLKKRASGIFRSRNRAVTSEDFAWLSYEASSSVGRSICLPKVNSRGEVVVIILPGRESIDLKEKLYPSSELLRRVKEYLSVRKLVGTKLQVSGPLYRSVKIRLKLVFRKEVIEARSAKDQINSAIAQVLHPLVGGNDGNGWEFGASLQKEFIQRTLDRISSIHHVEDIRLFDESTGLEQDKISIRPDELLYLEGLVIEDRRSEY